MAECCVNWERKWQGKWQVVFFHKTDYNVRVFGLDVHGNRYTKRIMEKPTWVAIKMTVLCWRMLFAFVLLLEFICTCANREKMMKWLLPTVDRATKISIYGWFSRFTRLTLCIYVCRSHLHCRFFFYFHSHSIHIIIIRRINFFAHPHCDCHAFIFTFAFSVIFTEWEGWFFYWRIVRWYYTSTS